MGISPWSVSKDQFFKSLPQYRQTWNNACTTRMGISGASFLNRKYFCNQPNVSFLPLIKCKSIETTLTAQAIPISYNYALDINRLGTGFALKWKACEAKHVERFVVPLLSSEKLQNIDVWFNFPKPFLAQRPLTCVHSDRTCTTTFHSTVQASLLLGSKATAYYFLRKLISIFNLLIVCTCTPALQAV